MRKERGMLFCTSGIGNFSVFVKQKGRKNIGKDKLLQRIMTLLGNKLIRKLTQLYWRLLTMLVNTNDMITINIIVKLFYFIF